ncbi:MAG TPA: DUF1887 family CARF protein [Dissulfurispiraceae bacterium]|nr:DUF1887 family CARF protein [Dissulfurispiraceae bacterium]
MKRVHVCLVSKEPIPNLVPLRCPGLEPDSVVLLVTGEMSAQAGRLERVMARWGIRDVSRIPVAAYDPSAVSAVCNAIIADHSDDHLLLNATGGTKIMALAAFETFARNNCEAFYVDSANRSILSLSGGPSAYPFADVVDVADYLSAYGQEITAQQSVNAQAPAYRAVAGRIVSDVDRFSDAIAILNSYVAQHRDDTRWPQSVPIKKVPAFAAWRELLNLLQSNGICKMKGNALEFASPEAVQFVSGDWLSFHVYETVMGISPRDARLETTVQWDQRETKPPVNNYDVLFTVRNRLYLIECKTKYFKEEQTTPFTVETVYKLDSLRDAAGGLFGKGMLVSYRALPDDMKSRLRAIKLEYCEGAGIRNLAVRLKLMIQ